MRCSPSSSRRHPSSFAIAASGRGCARNPKGHACHNDAAVGLNRDGVSLRDTTSRTGHLRVHDPASAETRVQVTIRSEPDDGQPTRMTCRRLLAAAGRHDLDLDLTGEDDAIVRIKGHVPQTVLPMVAKEQGLAPGPEGRVRTAVRIDTQDAPLAAVVAGQHHLAVALDPDGQRRSATGRKVGYSANAKARVEVPRNARGQRHGQSQQAAECGEQQGRPCESVCPLRHPHRILRWCAGLPRLYNHHSQAPAGVPRVLSLAPRHAQSAYFELDSEAPRLPSGNGVVMADPDQLESAGERESARLVRQAQTGDEMALTCLFKQCEPKLRARIHYRLSPRVRRRVVESDVLQQTLIVAARRLGEFEYREPGSFARWIGQIADNSALRVVRRHLAKKRNANAEASQGRQNAAPPPRSDEPTPSLAAIAGELQQRVVLALRDMPDDYQTVIQLLQHRRMTIVEAGELMGRSANAIKKLHARALADLADRLDL